jgi:hypothetical protein
MDDKIAGLDSLVSNFFVGESKAVFAPVGAKSYDAVSESRNDTIV